MKKIAFFLAAFALVYQNSSAQKLLSDCSSTVNEFHFSGQAPAPWAIDGKTTDWETILGKGKGNPNKPYEAPISTQNNWYYDGNPADLDNAAKKGDIKLFAYTYDSYNIYFYVRLAHKSNDANTLYYFFDVNVDGILNEGEPVISVAFDHKNASAITLSSYVPNTLQDYVPTLGNYLTSPPNNTSAIRPHLSDGYTIKGNKTLLFTEGQNNASFSLKEGEIFDAAITENGDGIELAIPWSFLKNYTTNSPPLNDQSVVLYHLALQEGTGSYDPGLVSDNAGQTREEGLNVGRVGSPKACLITSNVQKLGSTSYRFFISLNNPTNVVEQIGISKIEFSNIVANAGMAVNEHDFGVNVFADPKCNGDVSGQSPNSFLYGAGSALNQPIIYRSENPLTTYQPTLPGMSSCFVIDVTLPVNGSVKSVLVNIIPGVIMSISILHEGQGTLGDGGKPINPIGFTLEDDLSTFKMQKAIPLREESLKNSVLAFPNPAKENVTITFSPDLSGAAVQLMDVQGKLVKKWNHFTDPNLQLNNLKRGVYFLKIISVNGFIATKKIVVQ